MDPAINSITNIRNEIKEVNDQVSDDKIVESVNMTQLVIQAEKFGFNPAVVPVNITVQKGDLNHDGTLTPADAAIALAIAASGDGHVTSLDALMIMQAAAGRIEL